MKPQTETFSIATSTLDEARRITAGATCWVLSDGKAGDEAQCLGVTERLGLVADVRRVAPRKLFTLAMPWGPIDPKDMPDNPDSPIAPPYPDIAIASGRRTVAYLRHIRRVAATQMLTVFLKDPRTGKGSADLIWVPQHDRLRGANVLATLTSPHRISPERLAAAALETPPWTNANRRTVAGVLLRGDSQHHRFTAEDIADFSARLAAISATGALLAVTPSRRTPPALAKAVRHICEATGGWIWDGTGANPYLLLLAHSDHLVVTADSVNMLGEAAATGKPIHLFSPTGGHAKISSFVSGLVDHGAVQPLGDALASWAYPPLDATLSIAIAVADAFRRLRG